MFFTSLKRCLPAFASVLAAGLFLVPAPEAQAQNATPWGAYPAPNQVFSVTAPAGRWNQTYAYDLRTGAGTMGSLKSGSSTGQPYTLRSSLEPGEPYTNYIGIFIYDYTLAKWCEVFWVVDGSHYAYPNPPAN